MIPGRGASATRPPYRLFGRDAVAPLPCEGLGEYFADYGLG
jgi:hypothetical protein